MVRVLAGVDMPAEFGETWASLGNSIEIRRGRDLFVCLVVRREARLGEHCEDCFGWIISSGGLPTGLTARVCPRDWATWLTACSSASSHVSTMHLVAWKWTGNLGLKLDPSKRSFSAASAALGSFPSESRMTSALSMR